MLISCYTIVLFSPNFFDLSSAAFEISLFLCVKVDFGCSQFVVQNWRIPPQNSNLLAELSSWIEERFFPSRMTWFALQWWSLAQTLGYIVRWSGHRCLSSTVQDTTREGVLSQCWCSLILTLTTSIGIWHGAGATKGVTSPAAHRGIWHGAGARKSWVHSPRWSKSFVVIEKSLNSTDIFHLDDERNARRWRSNMS